MRFLQNRPIAFWLTFTKGSTNRRILAALITIASLTAMARLVSVVKELIVAWKFGTGDAVEAFLIAFLIPYVVIKIAANSFNFALIPTYIRVREHEGAAAAQRLLSGMTVWSLIFLGLAALLIVAFAPVYLHWVASGFDEGKLALTLKLTYVIAPTVVFSGIGNIWGAILNAGERFALVALVPIVTPIITVLLLLFARSLGVFALALGVLSGSALELLLLGVVLRMRGISLRPQWHGFDPHLRQVAGQFSPRVVSTILGSGGTIVDRSMAAMLPSGSVAALNYGNRVSGNLITIFGAALGSAVTPYLSSMVARGDWIGLRHTLRRYLSIVFLLTVPLAALLFIFSSPIVRLLYQRGSFTANDSDLVAHIQAFYVLQIPLNLALAIVGRLLAAFLASHITMWASAINLTLNVVLNIFFIKQIGVAGIALSTTCATFATFCFVSYFSLRLLRQRASDHPPKSKEPSQE